MVSQAEKRGSISEDEAALELRRLREAAKLAAIYYSSERKFQRRTDLSHIVHAGLHSVQLACRNYYHGRSFQVITLAIEIFHHVHHRVNQLARERDDTVPSLPEERNPIFFVYPICMLVSLILTILWLIKKILPTRPIIPLAVCATTAILMLLTGIMEMKHADMYIDVTEFTDEEILEHPIFIHNFVMCILSIFVMTLYLIQTWILFDQWQWIRKEQDTSTSSDTESSDSSTGTDVTENSIIGEKIGERDSGQVVQLAPIPTLADLSTPATIADNAEVDDEPIIYCCFVDWHNYIKIKMEKRPKHEFQVIHVM